LLAAKFMIRRFNARTRLYVISLLHYIDPSGSIYREIRARAMKEIELRISRLLQRVFFEEKKVTSNWSIEKQTDNRVSLDGRQSSLFDALL